MLHQVKHQLKKLYSLKQSSALFNKGSRLYQSDCCQILSISKSGADVLISGHDDSPEITVKEKDKEILYYRNGKKSEWDEYGIAALLLLEEKLDLPSKTSLEGKAYTREGMMKRALKERWEKASKAEYKITFADNIYGEHLLINEKGAKFRVTLRDFENETGYIDNPDWKTNKLGTTKHIMFAFARLKSNKRLYNRLSKRYPFVEIFPDPLNDYRITWHYPHELPANISKLIRKHFGKKKWIEKGKEKDFLPFLKEASILPELKIRLEVEEIVRKAWDREMLEQLKKSTTLDYSIVKATLFPYQKKGVEFATFRESAILADEMGLGKTIQAIATTLLKKQLFNFKRTLIICPASLKEQWKKEIEKFSNEKAEIVEGFPHQRKQTYRESKAYFLILNYETVLRDYAEINKTDPDFIILDEAQKIKNFSTITAQSIKFLKRKHALVLTGTPVENRLIDLYSIVHFADPDFLTPLWEFSYRYCYFDETNKNKITGYYNLQELNERLKPILLRREKRKVIKELPSVTEITVPVSLHEEQQMLHANYARGVASILSKKYISPFDQQKLMLLMNNMRMVCNSTYLIDKETHISPKLTELKEILTEKLNLQNSAGKVLIFSEWVTMLTLIEKLLRECGIGYTTLTGKVAVKNRNKLVRKFESDPECKVFLSTESGGSGLNLQVADTVINFELPWNPAKKNQRIGRIDRLGQRSKKLTVINLITRNSIETNIASGLNLKQNLFESVLNEDNVLDEVDFSASGRGQFLQDLENIMQSFLRPEPEEEEEEEEEEEVEVIPEVKEEADPASEEPEISISEPEAGAYSPDKSKEQFETMEKVMNNGMQFLSGLFKMATGKDLAAEDQKIEVDKETGEIVMRFKMPKM